jgi:hypothetical protein
MPRLQWNVYWRKGWDTLMEREPTAKVMSSLMADYLHMSEILQPELGLIFYRAYTAKLSSNELIAKLYLLTYKGTMHN